MERWAREGKGNDLDVAKQTERVLHTVHTHRPHSWPATPSTTHVPHPFSHSSTLPTHPNSAHPLPHQASEKSSAVIQTSQGWLTPYNLNPADPFAADDPEPVPGETLDEIRRRLKEFRLSPDAQERLSAQLGR